MNIHIIVNVFVIFVCLPAVIRCQEPRCAQFEYDERILGKLLAVESRGQQAEDHMRRLEYELNARYDELERKFHQTSTECLQQFQEMIDAATINVLRRPQVETDDWKLIFRGTAGNGDRLYDAWSKGKSVTTTKPLDMGRSSNKHYADLNFINDWDMQNISKVKIVLFHNEMDVASLVFNATGSSRDSWFQQTRLINSPWPSLTVDTPMLLFSIVSGHGRSFNLMKNHGGCPNDAGYFLVNDVLDRYCDWQKVHTSFPQFLFSTINGPTIWYKRMYGMADYLAIYANRNRMN